MAKHVFPIFLFTFCGLAVGCAREEVEVSPIPAAKSLEAPTEVAPETEARVRIVFLGDSLTAGYSLAKEQAFPFLLGQALESAGLVVQVTNAGVSGDTSAGGLRRLSWLLKQNPALVVLELGANDGLRGLPVEETEANLRKIIAEVQEAGARVLLLGMRIPPSYGPEYSEAFASLYPRLAEELALPLVPFLLEGVAAQPELNLPDGLHPNPQGHAILTENLLPYLEPLIRELSQGAPSPDSRLLN